MAPKVRQRTSGAILQYAGYNNNKYILMAVKQDINFEFYRKTQIVF